MTLLTGVLLFGAGIIVGGGVVIIVLVVRLG